MNVQELTNGPYNEQVTLTLLELRMSHTIYTETCQFLLPLTDLSGVLQAILCIGNNFISRLLH